jgi:hypothetical protein
MAENPLDNPHSLESILAECKRLREQSKKMADKAWTLAEKVAALRKKSPKKKPD